MLNKYQDRRYSAIKDLIEANKIQDLSAIFEIIPITVVAKDMGANYNTIRQRLHKPQNLTLGDLKKLSDLFGVSLSAFVSIIEKNL
jgi:hypothetical protein